MPQHRLGYNKNTIPKNILNKREMNLYIDLILWELFSFLHTHIGHLWRPAIEPSGPSFLQQRGDTDMLDSIKILVKGQESKCWESSQRSWSPWTQFSYSQDVAEIVGLPCLLFSLFPVIIYKKQYQTLWTEPEMCDRKAHYLTEGPIKKVSVW